jgi:hypothetical protein
MEVSGQLHSQAALTLGKVPWYIFDMRLRGPHSLSGHYAEEKNILIKI